MTCPHCRTTVPAAARGEVPSARKALEDAATAFRAMAVAPYAATADAALARLP